MHSRRPPSLRHKGNRRELRKSRESEQQEPGDSEEQEQKVAVTPTRKKRKAGMCSTGACMVVLVILALGFYAKFIHLTVSSMGKGVQSEGNIRGSLGLTILPKLRSSVSRDEEPTGTEPSVVDGAAEAEEKQWKELVKDQTTKEEGRIPEILSDVK